MRRKTEKRFEKLLDQWQTPKDAGEAIGFISTTFTFHSAFFEEEHQYVEAQSVRRQVDFLQLGEKLTA